MGKCPKACPTFLLVVTLLLYPASVTLVRICPASRLWVGLPRGPSSWQQHSPVPLTFCLLLCCSGYKSEDGGQAWATFPPSSTAELVYGGGRDGWLAFILPCSSYSTEAHIWIKDGVNNMRGFSPSSWVPQCLTEPGRTRDPHTPALLSTSSAFSSHRSRARPHSEEGPDFIYLSSSLTGPSGALLIPQAQGVQNLCSLEFTFRK